MTRMERRRRRRRILRIKLATTAAVLALTTASIVALTGGAAETAPEPTPKPPALQAEPVLLVAERDSTYQPVQMTAEPAQEPEPVEEEEENEKIEAALLEQGYLHEEIPLDFDLQCHLIAVCEEYGVPQNVALGVIQAESSFTATAANGSCYGYMQINSINSEWLSEKIRVTDLTDPYQNKLADDDLLLLSIGGTLYFIADIGLRMLSPRELYNAMGFPPDYIIDRDYMGNPYPKNEQVARCGNAVCPPMAAAVARANFPEYVAKVGDTITTMAALLDMVAV